MSDLAEQLVIGMRDYGVELSFEGVLRMAPQLNDGRIIKPRISENLLLSLSVKNVGNHREYYLTTSEQEPYWIQVASIFCFDYKPELLATVIAHLKNMQTGLQIGLPGDLEKQVGFDHLRLLSSAGPYAEMEQHLPGFIPIYGNNDLGAVFDSMLL